MVVGECGKPIVGIFGIVFNRIIPSNQEIEYATKLFDAFIVKHSTDIRKYIIAKKALDAIPKVPKKLKGVDTVIEDYDYVGLNRIHNITGVVWYDNEIKLYYEISTKKTTVIAFADELSIKDLENWKLNLKEKEAALNHLKNYQEYRQKEIDLENLKEKLSTCSI